MTTKAPTPIDQTLRALAGYQLQRTTGAAMVQYKAVFAAFGLRRTTFSCLSLIIDNPGLQQGHLAEALSIERSNIVQFIDELSSKGLVLRESAPADRRAYALSATAKGKALFKKALQAIHDLDQR